MKTLLALLLVLAALPAAAKDPCYAFRAKSWSPPAELGGFKKKLVQRLCEEVMFNPTYVRDLDDSQRVEALKALANEATKLHYKYWNATIVTKTEEEAKSMTSWTRGPSWKVSETKEVPGEPVWTKEHRDLDLANFFADNDWEISEAGQKSVVDKISAAFAMLDARSYKVTGTKISSSCSRFANTGKAANLTFHDLAERRALTMRRLVNSALGHEEDQSEDIPYDADGDNEDGTSGPASPGDDPLACGMNYSPLPDDVRKACVEAAKLKPGAEPTAMDLSRGWLAMDKSKRDDLRKKYYDPAKYVKVTFDYEIAKPNPTTKKVVKDTPMVALVAVLEAEKPQRPSRPPRERSNIRDRGRTDCANPNRRR